MSIDKFEQYKKQGYIPDPDFEGWDGKWLDDKFVAPKPEYNYTLLVRYMRANNKEFKDLTPEEREQFRIKD